MSRRDWLTAAVMTVIAVAVAAFLLRDTDDDRRRTLATPTSHRPAS